MPRREASIRQIIRAKERSRNKWAGSSAWLEDERSGLNVALTRQRSPVQIRSGGKPDESVTVRPVKVRSGPPSSIITDSSEPALSTPLTLRSDKSPLRSDLPLPCKGEILSHAFWMQKEGYRASTIESAISSLKAVARRANLLEPESAKRYLATAQLTEGRKEALTVRLARFYKYKGISWAPPRYKRIEKLPFIPLESEVDQLISGMGKKQACFLRLLKETGMRPGEAWQLQWKDVDTERCFVSVTPEKNSSPRQLKLSNQSIAMINGLSRLGTYIFHEPSADQLTSLRYFRRVFIRRRKRLAAKLQNPRLEQITFKTLRHFKATTEYHKTKDILHVMQLLGHKNIRNTLVYTHLVNWESDDFVSKVAKTVKEAQELIESGFDYVCDVEGYKLFRKRK